MRRLTLRSSVATLALLALGFPASAQTIMRVSPEIGAPGDIVIITGLNLVSVTTVRFNAFVGGVVGFQLHTVAPTSVTPTRVTAVVPVIGNFVPGGATPFGGIGVSGPAVSNQLTFYYCEETAGAINTPGLGTTAGGLNGRPVAGFTIAGGAPVLGNPLFTLTLENATPSATAMLAVGAPATLAATYLDGFIGIDLTLPFQLLPTPVFTVNAMGDVAFFLPIPAGPLNVTAALVWVILAPGTGSIAISDGLKVTL